MVNEDRVSETYYGPETPMRRRTRQRVHWLCGQAEGRVLDLGCSQGIATILLARESFDVVGVDVETEAVEYARAELAGEPEGVRRHAAFLVGDGGQLPFPDDSFDTVLWGEVIEHLVQPRRSLAEIRRVLRDGGRLVLTTPFGYHPHHDHKQTFYPRSLVETLLPLFLPVSLTIVDRYMRLVAHARDATFEEAQPVLHAVQPVADDVVLGEQQEVFELRDRLQEVRGQLAELKRARDQERRRAESLEARERELATAQEENERLVAELREQLEEARSQVRGLDEERQHAVDERDRLRALLERERRTLRGRVESIEKQRVNTRNELEVTKWKLRATRSRRWWRLGSALADARRDPRQLLRLPLTLLRLLVRKPPYPRRPEPIPYTPIFGEGTVTGDGPAPSEAGRSSDTEPDGGERGRTPRGRAPTVLGRPAVHRLTDVRVAAILDEMSEACFAPECHLHPVPAEGWAEDLEAFRPDLLLVESAWHGNDGRWQYQVGTYTHPDYSGLPQLRNLLNWCRERGVPTVFWNKEDPVHFDRFKEAAALFDVVLTTDAGMVERYGQLPDLRARRVAALPFAAQPRLHNPVELAEGRSAEPCFAGAFYRNRHAERREQLERLLDAAAPFGLVIYDRRHGEQSEAFGFPERFAPYIRGRVPYEQMRRVYKQHRVFLNANSVTESETMFSRRVFELLASGTAVLSTPSVGVESLFGEVVALADDVEVAREGLERLVDEQNWQRVTAEGLRRVMGAHTYEHRLAAICEAAGIEVGADTTDLAQQVALVADTATLDHQTAETLVKQSLTPAELVLLDREGDAGGRLVDTLRSAGSTVRVLDIGDSEDPWLPAVRATEAAWLATLDPATLRDTRALEDLAVCTRFAAADVIGFGERRHQYTDRLAVGGALVARDTLAAHGWPLAWSAESTVGRFHEGARLYSVGPPRAPAG